MTVEEIKSSYQDRCVVCGKLVWWPAEAIEVDLPDGSSVLACGNHTYDEVIKKVDDKSKRPSNTR